MNPAVASLLALIVALLLSLTSRINIGILAIALAWIIGVFVAGMKAEAVLAGFPATLFLTLTGVTFLFACAEVNGTLEQLAHRALSIGGWRRQFLPVFFFLLAMLVSSIGPGAIGGVALIIPLAVVIGTRAEIPVFLTSLMVANGANAGNLSPFSSLGIIANNKMVESGLGLHEGKVWFANFMAHTVMAAIAYLLLGGLRLSGTEKPGDLIERGGFSKRQVWTLIAIAIWIGGVIVFKLSVGPSAFACAAVLALFKATDEAQAFRRLPWSVIITVSGVTVLIALLEKTGGMDIFTGFLARFATLNTVNGMIAMIAGAISTYSSTAGVVLPAFLPIVPGLVQKLGGTDTLSVALSVNIGASVVDVSPLSTLGALCVAAVSDPTESRMLFRRLMIWGASMVVGGALFSQLFAGIIARL